MKGFSLPFPKSKEESARPLPQEALPDERIPEDAPEAEPAPSAQASPDDPVPAPVRKSSKAAAVHAQLKAFLKKLSVRMPPAPAFLARLPAGALPVAALSAGLLLLLLLTHLLTAARIAEYREIQEYDALAAVMADADLYEELAAPSGNVDGRITGLFAAYSGTTHVGWCVKVTTVGAHGPIDMVVGVYPTGNVTGIHIVSHREAGTAGQGIENETFLYQFVGKKQIGDTLAIAIPGASLSAHAVSEGVRLALELVQMQREGPVIS